MWTADILQTMSEEIVQVLVFRTMICLISRI